MCRRNYATVLLFMGMPLISSQACSQLGEACGTNSYYCLDGAGEMWSCRCAQGYHNTGLSGDATFSCTDVNECRLHQHDCGENTWCDNLDGSYQCLCLEGFHNMYYIAGKAVCSDVDECGLSPRCPENSVCVNTPGSYNCTCVSGFEAREGFCLDVDECNSTGSPCGPHAECINSLGAFNCRCKNGDVGPPCTDFITESAVTVTDIFSNVSQGKAIDQSSQNINVGQKSNMQAGSSSTETDSKDSSLYLGLGIGLGIALVGVVFVVVYLVLVKKRRHQTGKKATNSLPLRSSTSMPVGSAGNSETPPPVAVSGSPSDATRTHQYHTIVAETTEKKLSPEDIESMYGNHKIPKKRAVTQAEDGQVVYQVFKEDKTGAGVTRIADADPKHIHKSLPRICSSETLTYATVFDHDAGNSETPVETMPYKTNRPTFAIYEEAEIKPEPGVDQSRSKSPRPSRGFNPNYDRLEKLSIKSKKKQFNREEFENIYDDAHFKTPATRTERHIQIDSKSIGPSVSSYELVQVRNNH